MTQYILSMSLLSDLFGVCRLEPDQSIPDWVNGSGFYSVTKTADELSIVCNQAAVPDGVLCESDWRALKVEGPLDFSLVGILASISALLAAQQISIFAISTYDTDYILVKDKHVEKAVRALTQDGRIRFLLASE